MAIDYVLHLPCEVRKKIADPQLLAMVKHRALAEFAARKFKAARPEMDMKAIISECTVQMAVRRPDGTAQQMPVTIAQLLAGTAPLDGMKEHCKTCPANVADRDFGCIAKINYPITSETEKWLLSRLPEDASDPNLSLLFKFLTDLKIDGAPVDALRKRSDVMEAKTPAVRAWGGMFNKTKISSSQILHMLAFGGNIGAQQAQLYAKLLGFATILKEPHPKSELAEQFKTFACAVVMSGRLNANIVVDA